jgi:4-amino-4-deoxy-L-arabinose transferase-like glycosyltransferase
MTVFFCNWRGTVSLIFVLALLTRVAFVLTQQNGFYFPDSLQYSQAAVKLLERGEFGTNYNRAPAYPVLLAGVYGLFGESILAIRFAESFLGALLAVIIAALGKRIGGETVGALAGVIWAVYPMGIFIAGLVYPTNLAAALLACGVWCIVPTASEELSAKGLFSGGLFFGLAALAIPVALLTIIVAAGWAFFSAGRSRVSFAALVLLGSAVSLGPWTARNFFVYGQIIPVQPRVERYLPRMAKSESKDPDNRVSGILRHPELYASHFARNFVRFWELYPSGIRMANQRYRDQLNAKDPRVVRDTIYSPNRLINAVSIASTGPIFLFAVLGTVSMCIRRAWRQLSLLWFITLSFAVGYSFFYAKIRYRIPVEPFIIVLAAYGIHTAYRLISQRSTSAVAPDTTVDPCRPTAGCLQSQSSGSRLGDTRCHEVPHGG